MKKAFIIKKLEGETPLEALEKFRRRNPAYKVLPLTYAGRLDPLASGLLLVLAGEETKKKEKYLALSKEYKFEVLFGFATDTHDVMGKVTDATYKRYDHRRFLRAEIEAVLPEFLGTQMQPYPMYSSKTIAGIPLFKYARRGEEIEVPKHEIQISELKLLGFRKIDARKLLLEIRKKVGRVWGDFRQDEILRLWDRKLKAKKNINEKFFIGRFRVRCSSGTYVRVLADSLGEAIGTPALAYCIKRTKIGKWNK